MRAILFMSLALVACGPLTPTERTTDSSGTSTIIGAYNLEQVGKETPEAVRQAAHTVARMELRSTLFSVCTAVRVGPKHFMTSSHCARECANLQFTMGYEKDVVEADRAVFRCEKELANAPTLDYMLYEALLDTGVDTYPVAALSTGDLVAGMKALLPSHPKGRFLEVDQSKNCLLPSTEVLISTTGRRLVKHLCDADNGSSGAPVFTRDGASVIALHSGGRDRERDFNLAVPMPLIVEDLRAKLAAEDFAALSIAP